MKNNNITSFEFTLVMFAIRYAYVRQSIASQTLPNEIITEIYNRLTDNQKERIAEEYKNTDTFDLSDNWHKFFIFMDKAKHKRVLANDNKEYDVFEYNNEVYPIDEYIKNPYIKTYLPKENIIKYI